MIVNEQEIPNFAVNAITTPNVIRPEINSNKVFYKKKPGKVTYQKNASKYWHLKKVLLNSLDKVNYCT